MCPRLTRVPTEGRSKETRGSGLGKWPRAPRAPHRVSSGWVSGPLGSSCDRRVQKRGPQALSLPPPSRPPQSHPENTGVQLTEVQGGKARGDSPPHAHIPAWGLGFVVTMATPRFGRTTAGRAGDPRARSEARSEACKALRPVALGFPEPPAVGFDKAGVGKKLPVFSTEVKNRDFSTISGGEVRVLSKSPHLALRAVTSETRARAGCGRDAAVGARGPHLRGLRGALGLQEPWNLFTAPAHPHPHPRLPHPPKQPFPSLPGIASPEGKEKSRNETGGIRVCKVVLRERINYTPFLLEKTFAMVNAIEMTLKSYLGVAGLPSGTCRG
ncbi:PREDICTED: uncharacterized protein LOC107529627 [Miniopterus natalensis]|uniref:uncharacterized protein LOC107529627 n=1 Tax=Miniopterus natalensis TaxID=291302 RepID=UPI0007A6FBF7|nr:PREDICTED: uncharacterized protein LOC107529627 [Miniopterus natalensis]